MQDSHDLLTTLAAVLCTAGVATVVFQKLRQPVVLGYLLAGMMVGPHVPLPLYAHAETVQGLSELGVILLLFGIGLEFRLAKLARIAPTSGVIALVQCSLMFWLGYLVGRAFGWTARESIYTGAIISISSTTIIAKTFEERKVTGRVAEIVLGVLIAEDLIAILLLAILTTVSSGDKLSISDVALTAARLAAFLIGTIVVGIFLVPPTVRAVVRQKSPETTLIATIGICFGSALLAHVLGYSVALGAFIGGSLVAESGEEHVILPLVHPVRDVFSAVFFVSVGMLIDPAQIFHHAFAVVLLVVVVIVGKFVAVSLGAFLIGSGTRTSLEAGMSLAQIGEFSFIIAQLGLATGATRGFLYPIAVAVSAVTTLTTPWLIRASRPVASFVDAKMPQPLQTFVTFYDSWMDRLRYARTERSRTRHLVRLMIFDALALATLVIAMDLGRPRMVEFLVMQLQVSLRVGRVVFDLAALFAMLPFLIGILRTTRRLSDMLVDDVLPFSPSIKGDTEAIPRRALAVTLELAIAAAVGIPIMAITQPFLPSGEGAIVLLAVLVVLGVALWRATRNLHGHARAGIQVVIATLAKQTSEAKAALTTTDPDLVSAVPPSLGVPVIVRLAAGDHAIGKTLVALDLRGATGATVFVVARGPRVFIPDAGEELAEGDRLALVGASAAVDAARTLVVSGPPP